MEAAIFTNLFDVRSPNPPTDLEGSGPPLMIARLASDTSEMPEEYIAISPPGAEIMNLLVPPPPSSALNKNILSREVLAVKVAYTIENHRHWAANCPLDCQKRIVSKRTLREMRSMRIEVCMACGKRDNKEGNLLKFCARCKLVKYCSPECQRKTWNDHKIKCNRDNGKGMLYLTKTMLSNPFILHEIAVCIAHVFNLDKEDLPPSQQLEFAQKHLFVRMNVGVEPSNILHTAAIYRHQQNIYEGIESEEAHVAGINGVEGILQISNIHKSPNGHELTGSRRQAYSFWKDMRASFNEKGMRSVPIVLLEIVNNSTLITMHLLPIFPEMIRASRHQPEYNIQARPIHTDRPDWIDPIENRISHVNEHIRYDTKNQFLLRTPMVQRDITTSFKGASSGKYSSGMWYMKMLREPVYDAIRVLGEQDFHRAVANKLAEGKKDEARELCRDYIAALGYTLEFSD